MRVAVVREWLETRAGAEQLLDKLIGCFPAADLFAIVDFLSEDQRSLRQGRPVRRSFIKRLPFSRRFFHRYLPLMPLAVEQFDLSRYDLIFWSSYAVAEGVLVGPNSVIRERNTPFDCQPVGIGRTTSIIVERQLGNVG